jgi:hypothetical protein
MSEGVPDYFKTYAEMLERMDPEVLEDMGNLPPLEWVNPNVKEDGTANGPVVIKIRNLLTGEPLP